MIAKIKQDIGNKMEDNKTTKIADANLKGNLAGFDFKNNTLTIQFEDLGGVALRCFGECEVVVKNGNVFTDVSK